MLAVLAPGQISGLLLRCRNKQNCEQMARGAANSSRLSLTNLGKVCTGSVERFNINAQTRCDHASHQKGAQETTFAVARTVPVVATSAYAANTDSPARRGETHAVFFRQTAVGTSPQILHDAKGVLIARTALRAQLAERTLE